MRFAILTSLLLVACADNKGDEASAVAGASSGGGATGTGGPGGQGSPGGQGGADTGDTGGSDGGSSDGGGGADLAPCPDYTGVDAGRWWRWETNETYERETGFTGAWESEVQSWTSGATGAEFEILTVSAYEGAGLEDYVTETLIGYSCDGDGLAVHTVDTSYSYTVAGTPYSGWSQTTYDPPWITVPVGLGVGDTWSVRVSAETLDYLGNTTKTTWQTDFEVAGEVTRTVPAGTFTTLEIESTSSGYTSRYWADADIGSVEVYSGVLVSFGG